MAVRAGAILAAFGVHAAVAAGFVLLGSQQIFNALQSGPGQGRSDRRGGLNMAGAMDYFRERDRAALAYLPKLLAGPDKKAS